MPVFITNSDTYWRSTCNCYISTKITLSAIVHHCLFWFRSTNHTRKSLVLIKCVCSGLQFFSSFTQVKIRRNFTVTQWFIRWRKYRKSISIHNRDFLAYWILRASKQIATRSLFTLLKSWTDDASGTKTNSSKLKSTCPKVFLYLQYYYPKLPCKSSSRLLIFPKLFLPLSMIFRQLNKNQWFKWHLENNTVNWQNILINQKLSGVKNILLV